MIKALGSLLGNLFFAALFSIGALYLGVPAYQSVVFALAVDSFPSVEGVVLGHELVSEVSTRIRDEDRPPETEVIYTPWLVYGFSTPDGPIEAKEMLTAELLGHAGTSRERATAFVAQYPEGLKVIVHYNPRQPYEAALTTQTTKRFWAVQIGHLFVTLVALLLVGWFLWKGIRSVVQAFGRGEGASG